MIKLRAMWNIPATAILPQRAIPSASCPYPPFDVYPVSLVTRS